MDTQPDFKKNILNVTKAAFGCFQLMFICLFLLFLSLETETYDRHPSILFRISGAVADASLFTLPFIYLRGNWRYAAGAAPLAVALMILVNSLYFRNFHDLIPPSLYLNNQAGNPIVLQSAVYSLKLKDFIIAALGIIPPIRMICAGKRFTTSPPPVLFRKVIWTSTILAWCITLAGALRRAPGNAGFKEKLFPATSTNLISYYNSLNFTGYIAKTICSGAGRRITLSDTDLQKIRAHITATETTGYIERHDSLRPKNLILIVVESLPSVVLQRKDIHVVAPVIKALATDSASVYADRCKVLAGDGRSSDAQFMYNTGLLPLQNEILAAAYPDNNYPSVAKAFRKESAEIIGEDRSLWSHSLTTLSYGFGRLIDNAGSPHDGIPFAQDSLILEAAYRETHTFHSNFYLFVTTMSMHDPYKRPAVNHTLNHNEIDCSDPRDTEYLERLHHFDTALGHFISRLKNDGLYQQTAIAIVGDHEIRRGTVSSSLDDDNVPLIILNSGISGTYRKKCTQADIFPTLLDVMGLRYTFLGVNYRGLGHSIFIPGNAGKPYLPDNLDYKISEMIIRSIR